MLWSPTITHLHKTGSPILPVYRGESQCRGLGIAVEVFDESGKIVELALREVVHGRPVKNISTLANPEALDYFADIPDLQEN